MRHGTCLSLLYLSFLAACSDGKEGQGVEYVDEQQQTSMQQLDQAEQEFSADSTLAMDCPAFETLFAVLPQALRDETISEQYFSCDAVAPRASSNFNSDVNSTFWTFTITSRQLDAAPASLRWNDSGASDEQKLYLKQGMKASIELEAMLFTTCVNNEPLTGLPIGLQTTVINVGDLLVCIGTDGQLVEDTGWVARAMTPDYLYVVKVEGDKANRLTSAREAAPYLESLFRQFL